MRQLLYFVFMMNREKWIWFFLVCHVTISRAPVRNSLRLCVFWSWPLTNCWFSIGSLAHCKQGWVVRNRVKADLVQKWFSLLLFCVFWDYTNLKQKLRRINIQKSSLQSCKTQIEILAYPRSPLRLVPSAFEQPGPGGAPLLGLAKSKYYDGGDVQCTSVITTWHNLSLHLF